MFTWKDRQQEECWSQAGKQLQEEQAPDDDHWVSAGGKGHLCMEKGAALTLSFSLHRFLLRIEV